MALGTPAGTALCAHGSAKESDDPGRCPPLPPPPRLHTPPPGPTDPQPEHTILMTRLTYGRRGSPRGQNAWEYSAVPMGSTR